MWVPGSRHTSHSICAWSLPLWDISEKKKIQCTCAGMCFYRMLIKRLAYLYVVYGILTSLCCLFLDVMSPRPESVYPRYTSLCQATYWESKTWADIAANLGEICFVSSFSFTLLIYIIFPEWCREGGSSYNGQRTSSSREICVWDIPTYTAVNQVFFFFIIIITHVYFMIHGLRLFVLGRISVFQKVPSRVARLGSFGLDCVG